MGLLVLSYTRTPTKLGGTLQAAGKRPKSCCCHADLKAVPSIYTCRYCSAAMQTVLCGLLLVSFIITHSWLWMAPFLRNICRRALCVLPPDFWFCYFSCWQRLKSRKWTFPSLLSARGLRLHCVPRTLQPLEREPCVSLFLPLPENPRSSWPVNSGLWAERCAAPRRDMLTLCWASRSAALAVRASRTRRTWPGAQTSVPSLGGMCAAHGRPPRG